MIEFDQSKSLQELENQDWGEPGFDSHLVRECHRLHRIPLKDFTIENLRIMVGQNLSLNYLVPLAIEKLEQNPLAEGDFFGGDLLASVLRSEPGFWSKFPVLKSKVISIANEALEIPAITKFEFEPIHKAYNAFLQADDKAMSGIAKST